MDTFFFSAVAGLTFSFGLIAWRFLSPRWEKWFPPAAVMAQSLVGAATILGLAGIGFFMATGGLPAVVGGLLGFALPWVIQHLSRPSSGDAVDDSVERGSSMVSPKSLAALIKTDIKAEQGPHVLWGGVPLPRVAEPYHLMVIGSTGSGKSVAITELMDTIEARGDIAILVDSGGEFAARWFKSDRDFIINPFDNRCASWSPFVEIDGEWDVDALARSIIPDGVGDSKEWNGYAQIFLQSVMNSQRAISGDVSLKEVMQMCLIDDLATLKKKLGSTPAASQLQSEKTFGSIRTIVSRFLKPYLDLPHSGVDGFSIRRFCSGEYSGKRFLFLTYREDQLDSVKEMVATALDIAARTILSLRPSPERRVWLIIDEFASIGKVQSIESVATKARKVGGCLLLGVQSISQLKDRYGEQGALTILSCLNTWLVLKCTDPDLAEYASRFLGEAEVRRTTIGKSSTEGSVGGSTNATIVNKRMVLPVELQQLAPLHGFLKIAGGYPITSLKLGFPRKREAASVAYVPRDYKLKPKFDLSPATPLVPEPNAARILSPPSGTDSSLGKSIADDVSSERFKLGRYNDPMDTDRNATRRKGPERFDAGNTHRSKHDE